MPESSGWEGAFVAVSAALGEPREAVHAALGEAGAARAAEIARALQSPSRGARARVIAEVLGALARDVDALRLR